MYQNLISNFFVSAPISQHLSPSGDREGKIKVNEIRCLSLFSNITVFLKSINTLITRYDWLLTKLK